MRMAVGLKTSTARWVALRAGALALGLFVLAVAVAVPRGQRTTPTVDALTRDLVRAQEFSRTRPGVRSLDQLARAAQARRGPFLQLMASNPQRALELALPDGFRERLSPTVAANLEQRATVSGTLEVNHWDNFDARTAGEDYFLVTSTGDRVQLHFAGRPPSATTGASATVQGLRLADHLALSPSNATVAAAPMVTATATRKIAVLLINFSNNHAQPYAAADVRNSMFTNAESARAYYSELSFTAIRLEGKMNPDGDVFGWYTIPYPNTLCDYQAWKTAAFAAASQAGVNLTGYQHYVLMFPSTSSCGVTGRGELGGSVSWIWSNSPYTDIITHELGHNLGAHHAASLECQRDGHWVPIGGTCTAREYGDGLDVMGSSISMGFMDAPHQENLGLLDPGEMVDATVEGDYVLCDLMTFSTCPRGLRIPIPRTYAPDGYPLDYYYVEYRPPPYGHFDGYRPWYFDMQRQLEVQLDNGLEIRIGSANRTYLLDANTDDPAYDHWESPLPLGRTFLDPDRSIAITALRLEGIAFVRLSFTCTHRPPTATITPAERWGTPGTTAHYTLTIQNNDTGACGDSTVTVAPTLPGRWVQGPEIISEVLAPYQTLIRTLAVTSPRITIREQQPPDRTPEVEASVSPLPTDGTYPIIETATTTTRTGTADVATVQTNYTLDSTSPVVRIDAPAAAAVIQARPEPVEIRATATDDTSRVTVMEILLNGASIATCNVVPIYGQDPECSASVTPAVGINQITVTATDRAGNTGLATSTFQKKGSKTPERQQYTPEP